MRMRRAKRPAPSIGGRCDAPFRPDLSSEVVQKIDVGTGLLSANRWRRTLRIGDAETTVGAELTAVPAR